ncbi:hypothetical protein M2404_001481 [Rheinheimera pacifica]|uniref:hypothetical protein n=1 Tax=Rheinheimera pacifica TaxID=173990 RepID=UPI00216A941B|nr:hypothetical protein [Rheinheimera pacifica]MCS4307154.1 hypothetical protein [Rheinheimera pacifica]
MFRRYQTLMGAVSRLECLKKPNCHCVGFCDGFAVYAVFVFGSETHRLAALRYSNIFYALVDRNSCFAAIDNRLRNIISGKWRLVYAGGIKNVGFHHDFGMITPPSAAAQILLRHFERPNCQFLAELAGGLSH